MKNVCRSTVFMLDCKCNLSSLQRDEVTHVDRVRAVCGILKIGNAAAAVESRPAVQQAAISAIRSGLAFRASPFADDVYTYI